MSDVVERAARPELRRRLLAAALAGAASGSRSFTGLGALVVATRPGASGQPDKALAHPVAKTLIGLVTGQELVMDKLPATPERTKPLGLGTRAAGAAASGLIIARREFEPITTESDLGHASVEQQSVEHHADGVQSDRVQPDGDQRSAAIAAVACTGVAIAAAAATATLGVRFRTWAARSRVTAWLSAGAEDAIAVGLAAAAVRLTR